MTGLIVGIVAGALFGTVVALYVRQKKKAAGPRALTTEAKQALLLEDQRRILDLREGDVVDIYGATYLIESTLLYDEEGSVWKTYLLGGADDGRDRWLSVDDDDRLEIGFYEVLPPRTVAVPDPPPATFKVGDAAFTLNETGAARVRKRDAKGTRDMGRCSYVDYRGADRARLAVERWGDNDEVAIGKALDEDEIMILPGS